jgi:NADH-quinone oxidoreductase subunit J
VNAAQLVFVAGTLLAALGLWLLLPGKSQQARWAGMALGLAALGLLASQVPSLGGWTRSAVFWILAAVTIIAAAGTISFRNPVYCALWFALSLLGTAALFLFQGAQFLAVATVVVYAGAILVTFLFVLMLAQPKGQAPYDRVSWESGRAAATGAVLVGVLTMTLAGVLTSPDGSLPIPDPGATARQAEILTGDHVEHLGIQLFSRYLIAVEVAGVLLLVALVGAAAIVAQGKQDLDRPAVGDRARRPSFVGPPSDRASLPPEGGNTSDAVTAERASRQHPASLIAHPSSRP